MMSRVRESVSYYEKKQQPVQPASKKEARSHTMLFLSVIVLGGLLIASLAFAIMLWSTSASASPKRESWLPQLRHAASGYQSSLIPFQSEHDMFMRDN